MYFPFLLFLIFCVFVAFVSAIPEGPCRTPNGVAGKCVSIYNCTNLLNLLTNLNPEKISFLKSSQCGYESVPYVCCSSTNNFFNDTSNSTKTVNPLLQTKDICGHDYSSLIGGIVAELGEFPWLALLQYKENEQMSISCGGVLINNKYILTAAHCVTGQITKRAGPLISVKLGEYDLSQNPDCITFATSKDCAPPVVDIKIHSFLVHPDYNDSSLNRYHDIALVRLEKEVVFSDFVTPVCLPSLTETDISDNKNHLRYMLAGWGYTEDKDFHSSTFNQSKLLKMNMPFKDKDQCNAVFEKAGVTVIESQICIGESKYYFDYCHADSGAPLMYLKEDSWHLEGVLSFSTVCRPHEWTGVYTRILPHLKWIYDNVLP